MPGGTAVNVLLPVLPVLVGLLVGLVMGSLGGGGAIIAVPALVYLLGQPPVEATTTSLVVVGVTAVVGVVQHGRRGGVSVGDGVAFGLLGSGGAVLGGRMSVRVDPDALMVAFSGLLLVVAVLMWRNASRQQRSDPVEDPAAGPRWVSLRPFRLDARRALAVLLAASAVGWLTGFFGVGGGFAVVPALTLVLRMPLSRAVGTSLLVLTLTCAVGLASRVAGGAVPLDWSLIAPFTGAAVLSGLAAGRLTRRVHPAHLYRAFGGLLLAVAAYSLASSLPALL